MNRIVSLFSGTTALDMAVRQVVGGELVAVADTKPAAQTLLAHRHPDVPNLGDITAVDFRRLDFHVLVTGWPCQPHSSAGKRLGEKDPRALWPEVHRAIAEGRPKVWFGENVARITGNGELRRVVRSLAQLGYVGVWRCVRASDVGAAHRRDRCFVVAVDAAADTEGFGREARRTRDVDVVGVADVARARRDVPLTLLPTPTQSMTTGAGTSGRDGGLNLQTAVTLLPTPSASSYGTNQGGAAGRTGPVRESLDTMARNGRFDRWGVYANAITRWEHHHGWPAPDPTQLSARTGRPQLAPAFVEWLMGLPAGWVTDVPGLTRNQQLSLLGDGVVPAQASHAYQALLGALATSEVAA